MDGKTEVSQVIKSISFYFMNSWLYIITSRFAVKIFGLNIHKDGYTNQNIFPLNRMRNLLNFTQRAAGGRDVRAADIWPDHGSRKRKTESAA